MNIVSWIQANFLQLLAIVGGLHVILNTVGKLTNNKAIQGIDNLIISVLKTFGFNVNVDGTVTAPKA